MEPRRYVSLAFWAKERAERLTQADEEETSEFNLVSIMELRPESLVTREDGSRTDMEAA